MHPQDLSRGSEEGEGEEEEEEEEEEDSTSSGFEGVTELRSSLRFESQRIFMLKLW